MQWDGISIEGFDTEFWHIVVPISEKRDVAYRCPLQPSSMRVIHCCGTQHVIILSQDLKQIYSINIFYVFEKFLPYSPSIRIIRKCDNPVKKAEFCTVLACGFLKRIYSFNVMCMGVLPPCMSVHLMCGCCAD